MQASRVFVTGGAGVIGLELVPLLAARGARVLVGDLKPRPAGFAPIVEYRQGDLNEMSEQEIRAFAPDIVIHLAATFERSAESYEFWDQNFRHNVQLSHHVMSLVKDLPSLRRVVFASSYLIYDPHLYQFDRPQEAPRSLSESDPVMPRNLTGMAKLAHEIELRFLAGFEDAKFTSSCARIYRGYGRNSRDIISRWVRALLAGEEITVYRPEGVFDYVYAKDSAEGLIRLALADHVTGIINLGTGRSRSVQDVVDTLRNHFPEMRVRNVESDLPFEASQADMAKYRAAVGWEPEYDLADAIAEIVAHERQRSTVPSTGPIGNVLITSASAKVPLVRALMNAARKVGDGMKVFAGDVADRPLTSYVADAFWQMPRTDDQELDALKAGCASRDIRHVLPTRDGELLFWARNARTFADVGIDVIVSPAESVERCLDKLAFAEFGRDQALPFIPASEHPDTLQSDRFVVKERFGAGSLSIGLDLDRDAALAHGKTLESPIYQPFVRGIEISVDAWMDRNHTPKGIVLRRRDKVVNGESQITTTFRDEAIEAVMRRVLEKLNLRGPVVLQAMLDESRAVHVIECNSRFGGASTLSIAAGLDSLYWSLLEGRDVDLTRIQFTGAAQNMRQIRVPSDIYVHDPDL